MLLSELIAEPALGLRVLHRGEGDLDRPVGRPVITDLLSPGNYVARGDLVLTGLAWRRDASDSTTFVESIVDRGVSALIAGTAQYGTVPDDLVDACRERGLTVIDLPTDVHFADITERVAAAQTAADGARQSATLARQRQLLNLLASGGSLDELTARVSREIGRPCRVLTPTGRHVVAGPGALEDPTVDDISRTFLSAAQVPAATADDAWTVVPIGSTLDNRLAAWLVVVEGDHLSWPAQHSDAVRELAAISALDRARRDEGVRARRGASAGILALVESGAPVTELAPRLAQSGLDPDETLVVVTAELTGGSTELTRALLEDFAAIFGPPVVASGRGNEAVAFLPGRSGATDRVDTCLSRLAPGLGRMRLRVGVGGQSTSDSLHGALEEARFARKVAGAGAGSVSVVATSEVASHVLLLAAVPDEVRRSFTHRVLDPLIDHDAESHSDLIGTLRTFLECSGSWSRTAAAMHLHVNTVRYRIEKIQELTGRDLSALEERVDFFLALSSL